MLGGFAGLRLLLLLLLRPLLLWRTLARGKARMGEVGGDRLLMCRRGGGWSRTFGSILRIPHGRYYGLSR